jgi:hypothetical protein
MDAQTPQDLPREHDMQQTGCIQSACQKHDTERGEFLDISVDIR